jgi:hypothetical protein
MSKVRLEQWAIRYPDKQGYRDPAIRNYYLTGYVYGHPRKKDGSAVSTSTI